jgi:hypothetical protein
MTDTIEHDKTPDAHSSIVGGSSASRLLGCPGSVDLLAKLPESVLRESSKYADEGTALHEVMAYIVDKELTRDEIINDPGVTELWDRYAIKDERLWDCVYPAFEAFDKKCEALWAEGGPDAELLIRVESEVHMPGIEGAFGTADVLIRGPKRTVVWDWKFGEGVPVYASYEVGVNEYGNDQLCFYARAALESFPQYFEVESTPDDSSWPVDLVICQPRIIDDGAISEFTVTVADLETFRLDLVDAVEEALSGKGKLAVGSYCRFAKCKTICPLHNNGAEAAAEIGAKLASLQLRASAVPAPQAVPAVVEEYKVDVQNYAENLGLLLDLADMLEPVFKEGYAQAHTLLEAGVNIPGYRLVPKKAGWDKWAEDRKKVDAHLARRGLDLEARREPWEPISPAQARTKLKALGLDMKDGSKDRIALEKLVQKGVSSGSTVAPTDDPRPDYASPAIAAKVYAEKIGGLLK